MMEKSVVFCCCGSAASTGLGLKVNHNKLPQILTASVTCEKISGNFDLFGDRGT